MAKSKLVAPNAVLLQFETEAAARYFREWLCESGEQDYWQYMEAREDDDPEDDITGLEFDYHHRSGLIPVKCGRFTEHKEFPTDE